MNRGNRQATSGSRQATKAIERKITEVKRDLREAQGTMARYEEGTWEHGQALAQVRKLLRKVNDLDRELAEVEGDW